MIKLLYHLSFQSDLHNYPCRYRNMTVSGLGYSV